MFRGVGDRHSAWRGPGEPRFLSEVVARTDAGDANYIFKASKMASATTDFLLAFVREPEPVAVG